MSRNVETLIREQITQVLAKKGLAPRAFDADASIMEDGIGLDSLDVAELVVRLEMELNIGPMGLFELGNRIRFGDLVRYYSQSA
jgi:acyl carrier protein